ncbi:MAG: type 2 isopentenyl-diphosphate Delta-isomerase [Actinomycetota bacterium]|nr:type 2 isopentenyl-diphosphate Delta-isomerase [Actinomycetota bacterium]
MVSNSGRKLEHLNISLNGSYNLNQGSNGLSGYRFLHQALPQADLKAIDTSTNFLGKPLKLPLMISPMVGGIKEAQSLNRKLAQAAQMMGIAMGVGSQRTAIEDSSQAETYRIRDVAPGILLLANLGAVQLNYGYGLTECRQAVEMIEADGLCLHLNCIQEAFQSEGNQNFSGLAEKIKEICSSLGFPVIAREVGFGIDANAARMLLDAGVSAIDVGGRGGTSWIEIEKIRSRDPILKEVAGHFSQWGISTADSLNMVRAESGSIPLIASGGIRSGLEAAKCIALGADLVGIGLPMLQNVNYSVEVCLDYIRQIEAGLRIAMFGIGARDILSLKNTKHLVKGVPS